MTVLFCILGFVILLTLASGAYVFTTACLRKKELPWLLENEIKKTTYGKYYECMKDADEWLQDHNVQDVYITSDDRLRLRARWVPAENAVGTVLFAHGYRSTPILDFGVAFPTYHEMGFNILVPDHRCHGKSEGRFITFGVKESKDMCRWIDYHNSTFGMFPVLLSGMSMGASTVMYMADEPLPENVKAIIADCGFTTPKDILSSVFKSVTHLPAAPSIWATDLFARLFAGFSLTEKDTRKTLTENKLPILIVHGEKDDFVPCYMSKEAYAACGGPKKLLLVKGADHGVSFLVEPDKYTNEINAIVDKLINH